jgi:hypothetical protein
MSIIESLTDLPLFPDVADQFRRWLKSRFARLPTRGGGFRSLGFAHQLEGVDLPQRFADITTDRRREDLETLDNAVRIDDKPAPGFDTAVLIVDAVNFTNAAVLVRKHGEGHILVDHLGELVVVPHLVNVNAIDTHGEYFRAERLQFGVFFSDR